jgi:hypothetical protein
MVDRRLVFQSAQHPSPANAQDRFLAQPVIRVASVKLIGHGAIGWIVLFQIGIEKINRNPVPRHPFHVVAPRPHRYRPALNCDRDHRLFCCQRGLRTPRLWLLRLNPIRVQMLLEVPFAVRQGHGRKGQSHIRCRTQRVASQNPEPPAVRRKLRNHSDFHGEVSDNAAFAWFFPREVLRTINKAHR